MENDEQQSGSQLPGDVAGYETTMRRSNWMMLGIMGMGLMNNIIFCVILAGSRGPSSDPSCSLIPTFVILTFVPGQCKNCISLGMPLWEEKALVRSSACRKLNNSFQGVQMDRAHWMWDT